MIGNTRTSMIGTRTIMMNNTRTIMMNNTRTIMMNTRTNITNNRINNIRQSCFSLTNIPLKLFSQVPKLPQHINQQHVSYFTCMKFGSHNRIPYIGTTLRSFCDKNKIDINDRINNQPPNEPNNNKESNVIINVCAGTIEIFMNLIFVALVSVIIFLAFYFVLFVAINILSGIEYIITKMTKHFR
jgi:hypothetical protein